MYVISWIILCYYCISVNCAPQCDGPELLSVVQVFRHGQRVPFQFYPNDPYKNKSFWNLNPAQLTNKGKQQAYNLGRYTRERYEGFLPVQYSDDFFKAYTTDTDRTHMSAQAYIAGLYPPTVTDVWNLDVYWQPIPVRPIPNSHLHQNKCPRYTKASDETVSERFRALRTELGDVVSYIANNSGVNVDNALDVVGVADALFIENDVGYQLPEWSKPVYPEPLLSFFKLYIGKDGDDEVLRRLGVGPFLNIIVETFNKKLKDPSTGPKLTIYSGHDLNILALLKIFGHDYFPMFSSSMYFELWKSEKLEYINVYLKNEDLLIPIKIAGCEFNCNLSEFKNLFSKYIIDDDTFRKECQLESDKNENGNSCVVGEGKES